MKEVKVNSCQCRQRIDTLLVNSAKLWAESSPKIGQSTYESDSFKASKSEAWCKGSDYWKYSTLISIETDKKKLFDSLIGLNISAKSKHLCICLWYGLFVTCTSGITNNFNIHTFKTFYTCFQSILHTFDEHCFTYFKHFIHAL